MIDVHVSVIGNMVLLLTPPLSLHELIPPPPAPPVKVPAVPAVEVPVPVMWPPGFGLQQNKLTTTVLHKFQFIMLEGHDCGYMIPHVTIPPANLLLPIMIMFSSRKAMFSASKVKANGTAVGCSQLLPFPLPMMTCGAPVSLPSSYPAVNVINNVTVGMTPGDLIAGALAIAFSLAADVISNKIDPVGPFKKNVSGDLLTGLVGASSLGGFLVKTGFGMLTGAAKIVATGEGSIGISVGSSYAGGGISYTRTAEGANQFTAQGQVGGPLGSASTSAQHTSNADGTTSNKVSTTAATPVGQVTKDSETYYDAKGNETQTTSSTVTTGGAPLPAESGVAGTHQSKTVTTPGSAPTTTDSGFGTAGSPFGGGQLWGDPL